MRILMVNTRHYYGGGDSTYTFNLCDLLTGHGHEIAFFAMQDERNLPDPNADLFVSPIEFRDLVQHKTLANGIKVLTRSVYSVEARRKFGQMLDRFQPDIVHLQSIHSHITLSILFETQKRRLPVVWTLHDYRTICPNSHFLIDQSGQICEACRGGRFYHAPINRCKKGSLLASGLAAFESYCEHWMGALNKVDAFLAPSRFLRSKLLENGFKNSRVRHLPLFLPQQNFWEGQQDGNYLLFLGRLEHFKGVDTLIEAARQAKDVPVIIAGSASEAYASRLPGILPGNARYVGMKHGQELTDLTRNALAIVLPSICYENQPFSILEAFAAGKPAIASDLGGMTELVAHQERGLLVPPGDSAALADAMNWAINHRDQMKEMGRNARQYAQANHSPEQHYQSLTGIYSEMCRLAVR